MDDITQLFRKLFQKHFEAFDTDSPEILEEKIFDDFFKHLQKHKIFCPDKFKEDLIEELREELKIHLTARLNKNESLR